MKHSLLIICILILIVIVCGCATTTNTNSNTQKDVLPKDKYVVVYEVYNITGTLIGNPPDKPLYPMSIPWVVLPFDYYDPYGSLARLGYLSANTVNDNYTVLWGSREIINQPDKYGDLATFAINVYDLPYTRDNFTIVNISSNGTINALFNNTSIILGPGGQWASPDIIWTGMGRYMTDEKTSSGGYLPTYHDWPVSYETNITISNMGLYNKLQWNNSYAGK